MTTTSPSFTKEIRRNRENRDFDMFLDGQYIGSHATYHQAEIDLDAHVLDLLSSDLVIPASTLDGQCGDCGATLDSMGLCGCRAEGQGTASPSPENNELRLIYTSTSGASIIRALPHDERTIADAMKRLCARHIEARLMCDGEQIGQVWKADGRWNWLFDPACIRPPIATTDHTRPAPLSCICGQPAFILEPHGAFCGACHEAVDLWRLWKEDSTQFVAELRRQSCRLDEMAARLCVYLNAKNGSALGTDSILAMWRNLLDDGDPPEPRFYVVAARQQVAA